MNRIHLTLAALALLLTLSASPAAADPPKPRPLPKARYTTCIIAGSAYNSLTACYTLPAWAGKLSGDKRNLRAGGGW
jgi:hypothetical protein